MREIHGLAGLMAGVGREVLADEKGISVRVVDGCDNFVAVRVGEHPHVARMTPDEADFVAGVIRASAKRCRERQVVVDRERAERLERLRANGAVVSDEEDMQ